MKRDDGGACVSELHKTSVAKLRRDFSECGFESFDFRWSALRHVLASAAAPTEACNRFLHERSHVERLARGLGKYQCRLIGSDTEKRDYSRALENHLSGQQLDERQVAIGKSADEDFASATLRSFCQ